MDVRRNGDGSLIDSMPESILDDIFSRLKVGTPIGRLPLGNSADAIFGIRRIAAILHPVDSLCLDIVDKDYSGLLLSLEFEHGSGNGADNLSAAAVHFPVLSGQSAVVQTCGGISSFGI